MARRAGGQRALPTWVSTQSRFRKALSWPGNDMKSGLGAHVLMDQKKCQRSCERLRSRAHLDSTTEDRLKAELRTFGVPPLGGLYAIDVTGQKIWCYCQDAPCVQRFKPKRAL